MGIEKVEMRVVWLVSKKVKKMVGE